MKTNPKIQLRAVTDYHVCGGDDEADLDKQVAEYIADGFEPLGGVAAVVHQENSKLRGTWVQLFQAVVKRRGEDFKP